MPVTQPVGLPATGVGAAGNGGLGLVLWVALVFAGAVALGAAMFLAARRSRARR